jgi:GNAT superfamily N-acetyltransferase
VSTGGAVVLGVRVTGPVAMMAIMRPLIRPLTPVDIAAVVEFSLRAWAPVFESFRTVLGERVYQAIYPDWSMTQARAVEAVCQDDTAEVWVAEQLGRPVGYVAVRIHADDRTGEIEMLAVDPLVQRQGIGTALTSFACSGCVMPVWGSRLSAPAVTPPMLRRAGSTRRQASSVCRWSGTTRASTPTRATCRLSANGPVGRSLPKVLDRGALVARRPSPA